MDEPKLLIEQYPNTEALTNICKTFENQAITLTATFMGRAIPITNCNAMGDILENIFYPSIKEVLGDFEEGPAQASPDYYGMEKNFEFEQKVFKNKPGFDIGNFASYIDILSAEGGVYKKIFRTKYLVFEYDIIDTAIKIIKFHYLSVYKLVGYSSKTAPITMQIKRNVWYNIRPDNDSRWYAEEKTPPLFIDKIIECIQKCPNIENKSTKIASITKQFNALKSKYKF